MAVRVDSGPVNATDRLETVPREKWHDLMCTRAAFLAVKLSYDCRCLVEFVADAEVMYSELGYASAESMIREGYRLQPEEINIAVEWLKLNPSDEMLPLDQVKQLAAAVVMKDAKPVGKTGRPRKGTSAVPLTKGGNDRLAARIKKKRPDIAAAVERGEYPSMRAAAIAAGIITPPTPLDLLRRAWMKASSQQRIAFLSEIRREREAA